MRGSEGGVSDELAYGSAQFQEEQAKIEREAARQGQEVKICLAGSVQGDYSAPWEETFDFYFLCFVVLLICLLMVLTKMYEPLLWTCSDYGFWYSMGEMLLAQLAIGIFGGLLCRCYCKLDEKGYVMTSPKSYFKVNYTRKIQHLAAYLIPLVIEIPQGCTAAVMYPDSDADTLGLIQAWWSHAACLVSFVLLIKPFRERFTPLMMAFNAMDRPEDRPNCLNWLIGGNVLPGYCLLIPLRFVFSYTCQQNLVYVVIFIVGLGDGLAEPVGIHLGKHKYQTRGCEGISDTGPEVRYYTRSWEGSATVFLSGVLFPCIQYYLYANVTQFLISCICLPPLVTAAEALAPHSMDTVSLILVAAGVMLLSFWCFPDGHISPDGNPSCIRNP